MFSCVDIDAEICTTSMKIFDIGKLYKQKQYWNSCKIEDIEKLIMNSDNLFANILLLKFL